MLRTRIRRTTSLRTRIPRTKTLRTTVSYHSFPHLTQLDTSLLTPSFRKVAGGASSRSSGKIVPNFPRKAGDPDTLICQLDGCLKEVKVASIKVHIKRHHDTHFEAIYGVAMPPRFSCGWTNCHATFATRSQRPDHLLAVHGYEDDEKELNEDYVRRMSTKQLKIKFAQQAASLNKLRQTIGNLETEIHARDESYVHGYDKYLDEPQPESTSAKQDAAKQLVKLRILVRQHREIEHELKEFLESLCAEREGKLTEPEQVEDFDQEMMDT